ncbi:flagellar hook-length control protein FliK [Massilia oculi]|uniref:flagellar hook-length control protein FliK n=1 Tax=Massilia oculi TaxID=945844 RepID=UPI001AAE5F1D|nr:flagellar hook-length control protein FliK [Massilia oculi]
MTTQTTNLLFQTTGANASAPRSASPDRLADSARNNGAFGATLSRELAARQQAPQPQSPAPAAQQSKPAAQQQSKPNAADKPANREPVREQAKAGAKPATHEGEAKTTKTASAEGAEETGAAEGAAEAAEAAAAATTPVTDMLAFMASLTRPAAADATPVPADTAAADAGDQQLKALASALEHMTGAAGDDAATGAAAVTDELGKGVTLAAGVQRAPVDPNAPQGQAGALPEGQQDAAQFQTQLREHQQQLATTVEEAPAPLAQLQAQAAKMADAVGNPAAVPGDRIPARVGSQAWDNQVSQRIVYMVGKEQAATLTLNPPDLGPVQIVLNVSNDQASVAFSAEQLEVRQALENALPRLREMMSESGIALNNATVDAGARQQQQDGERRTPGGTSGNGNLAGAGTGGEGEAAVNEVAPRTRTVGLGERGMVDLFA